MFNFFKREKNTETPVNDENQNLQEQVEQAEEEQKEQM